MAPELSQPNATGPGLRQRFARRIGWTLSDQILSSGTNFLLNILVIRVLPPAAFGAFALAYATYLLLQGVARGLVAQPLMIRFSAAKPEHARRAYQTAMGATVVIGIAASALLAGGAAFTEGVLRSSLLALVVVLPAVLVQDTVRFIFFADSSPEQATLNDAVWGVVQVVAIVLLAAAGADTSVSLLLAWGASGAVAGLIGLVRLRLVPNPLLAREWFSEHFALGKHFAAEAVIVAGSAQVTMYSLGLVTNLREVAQFRTGQVLMGPLNVLFNGARLSLISEGVRIDALSRVKLRKAAVVMGLTMAATALAFGTALYFAPSQIGEALLDEQWDVARALLPWFTLAAAGRGLTAASSSGLRVLGRADDVLIARAVIAPFTIVTSIVGAATLGAEGAAISLVCTAALSSWLYWRRFLTAVAAPVPAAPVPAAPVPDRAEQT